MSNSAGIWASASTLHKTLSACRRLPEDKKQTTRFSAEVNELTSWRQSGDLRQEETENRRMFGELTVLLKDWSSSYLVLCSGSSQLWGSLQNIQYLTESLNPTVKTATPMMPLCDHFHFFFFTVVWLHSALNLMFLFSPMWRQTFLKSFSL